MLEKNLTGPKSFSRKFPFHIHILKKKFIVIFTTGGHKVITMVLEIISARDNIYASQLGVCGFPTRSLGSVLDFFGSGRVGLRVFPKSFRGPPVQFLRRKFPWHYDYNNLIAEIFRSCLKKRKNSQKNQTRKKNNFYYL